MNEIKLTIDAGNKDITRADTLRSCMRQWQILNDEPVSWNEAYWNYFIYFDYATAKLCVECDDTCRYFGQIYFSTEAKAQEAMNIFHDELMWYFTEYSPRVDKLEHNKPLS